MRVADNIGRQTQGGRRLLLTSDFQVEIFFNIECFYGSITENKLETACTISQASFLAWFRRFFGLKTKSYFFALFVYLHTTLSKWLSTLDLYADKSNKCIISFES